MLEFRKRLFQSRKFLKFYSRMGMMGVLGFFGFLGIWFPDSYSAFLFFSFFSFYWHGKLLMQKEDERLRENCKAGMADGNRIGLCLIFIALVVEQHLQLTSSQRVNFFVILISLGIAVSFSLGSFLAYCYDVKGYRHVF